ncbi:DUF2849 domain-containing protein [Rhodovulum marinum]|uniref:Uncharacterized protein DUF2849 n=1 Tax=Rhodovulum marinum TaxID=320662 RepID=A0A4V2SQU5_9RHOB|nr:DUF2849 domain-containing protein [Rhodovulum marinum]TCP40406.1 uncharacterized protein DUF2849 [Rhodovulum marinum]
MTRIALPAVVTANDLLTGDAIWLTPGGNWSRALADAELLSEPARAQARLAQAAARPDRVVAPYLAAVRPGAFGPRPVEFRERVRARGPARPAEG